MKFAAAVGGSTEVDVRKIVKEVWDDEEIYATISDEHSRVAGETLPPQHIVLAIIREIVRRQEEGCYSSEIVEDGGFQEAEVRQIIKELFGRWRDPYHHF